ncbi:MAG TPA: hypothetical protein VJ866_09210 [Pyrinomonadaceae bacterium]|nr:hypothetical protein [Pyrinomonadaceae bacterium]
MKILGLVLLVLIWPALTAAQETAAANDDSHGVKILKARWQKRFYNPALDEDPMNASSDAAELTRARQEVSQANTRRVEQRGRYPLPPPTEAPSAKLRPEPGPAGNVYLYEVTVSNRGTKKIRSIVWEYVLYNPATKDEVGHHEFESNVGIEVGKSKSLVGASSMPPASVVHVSQSDKETREQYADRVDIRRVVYEDGTVWERK